MMIELDKLRKKVGITPTGVYNSPIKIIKKL